MKINRKGNIFLILAAIIWGVGLVSQQAGMDYLGPFGFTALRCTLGSIALLPVVLYRSKKTLPEENTDKKGVIKASFVCAMISLATILLQQYGLLYTSVGKAGFITALYILITPVSGKFLLNKPVAKQTWIAVGIALVGMYFLCMTGGVEKINLGDIIMMVAAFSAAMHIHILDHYVAKFDPVKITCYQFIFIGLICFIPAFLLERDIFTLEYVKLSAVPIIYAGLCSCALGYTFQSLGQKYTEPNTASLLLSMETVFSLMAGWLILGEVLAPKEYVGCVIMLVAIVIAQLPQRKKEYN